MQSDQFLRDALEARRPVPQTPQAPSGDVNQSGNVDSIDTLLLLQKEAGLLDDQFNPVGLAHGGTLNVDPRRAQTSGTSIAGPATVVDRLGKTAAVIGEGGGQETISNVQPTTAGHQQGPGAVDLGLHSAGPTVPVNRPSSPGVPSRVFGDFATDFQPGVGQFTGLPRDVALRLQEILNNVRGAGPTFGAALDPREALQIAQRPADFEQFTGMERDPIAQARAVAARGLAQGIQQDVRFGNPLVRQLALGRSPTPADFTAREFSDLGPFNRDVLSSIIGPDLLPEFLFAIQQGTPQGRGGVRQLAAGGVRV